MIILIHETKVVHPANPQIKSEGVLCFHCGGYFKPEIGSRAGSLYHSNEHFGEICEDCIYDNEKEIAEQITLVIAKREREVLLKAMLPVEEVFNSADDESITEEMLDDVRQTRLDEPLVDFRIFDFKY